MSLPPTPPGYDNWNQYIAEQGAIIAAAQGLTYQQGKASVKLLDVAEPVRKAVGTPSYRIYNEFTTWADRQVIPQPTLDPDVPTALGRPWRLGSPAPGGEPIVANATGDMFITEVGSDLIVTE